jgi:hypothetical protein
MFDQCSFVAQLGVDEKYSWGTKEKRAILCIQDSPLELCTLLNLFLNER